MSDENETTEEQPQQEDTRPRLTHFTGNLGGDPKIIKSEKMSTGRIVKLNLAVPMTNGSKENPGLTFWVDVAIMDAKMQARALDEQDDGKQGPNALKKGDKIAVVGVLEWRDYQDKKYAQTIANRLSFVDWWEKEPYVPRAMSSEPSDFVAPW
jgi:single-stranded DNA-binding protein